MTPPPTIIQYPASSSAYRSYTQRPRRGLYLHHTATSIYSPSPISSSSGSWHLLFLPNGDIRQEVPPTAAAFCVLRTDIFTPTWQLPCPDAQVSDANYCSDNWEIQYAPQDGEYPTHQQITSLRYALLQRFSQFGPFPILGHGQVQSDKWPSEPTNLDWSELGLYDFVNYTGYIYTPPPPPPPTHEDPHVNPATDATIKANLEQLGVGINPDTAIMQFVYAAYRAGDPPFGNWRGPAMPTPPEFVGEYDDTAPDGSPARSHRFTAGIVQFNLNTGGIGWKELVREHPELS